MKIGIGSYAYRWSIGMGDYHPPNRLTPIALLHKAAELNVKLVQYADNLPLHQVGHTDIKQLAQEAQELDIEMELGVQSLKHDLLLEYLKLAEYLGVKLIRISLDMEDAAKPVGQLEREFNAVLPHYQMQGVSLAIENHFHFPSPRLVTIVQNVDHPSLGICLDVANSIAVQEWPQETIQLLVPYAINLHLKDYRIQLDPYGVGFKVIGTPLGQGQLDIPGVFESLSASERSVNVILEHWMPRAQTAEETQQMEDDWIKQSVHVAKQFVQVLKG